MPVDKKEPDSPMKRRLKKLADVKPPEPKPEDDTEVAQAVPMA